MKKIILVCSYIIFSLSLSANAQRTSAPPNYNVEKLNCESQNGQYVECRVYYGTPFDVILERQSSREACVRGRSFGLTRFRAMWVDHGCRGSFKVLTR